jgi:hypothetical protein
VRIHESVKAEQAQAWANVLLDELPLIVNFISSERRLGESRGARARSADDCAVDERVSDGSLERRPGKA